MFVVVLLLLNGPWLAGSAVARGAYLPAAVRAGEWWRLVTHPFVHVGWYHLALDGAAFLLLYASLRQRRWWRRLTVVAAAGAGSLFAAQAWAPAIESLGLCGLSGIAHGLMAVTALELIRDKQRIGLICLGAVAGKALWEAVTGQVLFASLHAGSVGTPIAVSHLGGVLGAMAVWAIGTMIRDPGRDSPAVAGQPSRLFHGAM